MKKKVKLLNLQNVIILALSAMSLLIVSYFYWDTYRNAVFLNTDINAIPKSGEMLVYKTPNCRCCSKWARHVENSGINVSIHHMKNLNAIRAKFGIDANLKSCHTAVVDNYVFEGHIPVDVIKRFLAEKPDAIGLVVPGMPVGSPGMEKGGRRDPYNILMIHSNGDLSVYAREPKI